MPPVGDASVRRGVALVGAVGFGVGIAVAGLTYSILAIPLYVFARTDPDGLDRPLIRTAFFNVALPAGVVVGVVAGVLVGVWYRRGGRLPAAEDR
jgi:hypothetical protein